MPPKKRTALLPKDQAIDLNEIAKEQELRIQAEALESQAQNAENIENLNAKNVQQQIVDDNNISTPN